MDAPLTRVSKTFEKDLLALRPQLMAFAMRFVGTNTARAEDLVQDTFMRAWAARNSFEEGTNMKAWVFTILRNKFLSEYRHRRREVEDPEGLYEAGLSEAPRQSDTMELQDVLQLVDKLPVEQRETVHLFLMGHTYTEMANMLGCREGTVKSRIFRARTMLTALVMHGEQNPYNTFDYDPEGYKAIYKALENGELGDEFDPLER